MHALAPTARRPSQLPKVRAVNSELHVAAGKGATMADANLLVDALLAALPCRCARCTPRLASAGGGRRGRHGARPAAGGRFLANSGGVAKRRIC